MVVQLQIRFFSETGNLIRLCDRSILYTWSPLVTTHFNLSLFHYFAFHSTISPSPLSSQVSYVQMIVFFCNFHQLLTYMLYLRLAEDDWKRLCYNLTKSFHNNFYKRKTTWRAYIRKMQNGTGKLPTLISMINFKGSSSYFNSTKRYILCLYK